MRSQERLAFDLGRLVDSVKGTDGVLAIVLFGSEARGVSDEYSDYDLLVLFKDRQSMLGQWEKLFERVGKLRLLVHVIPKTLQEFEEKTEPTFLESLLRDGKILYLKYPLEAPAQLAGLKPVSLISFRLSKLRQNEKMMLIYRLYGKKGGAEGMVAAANGVKLGAGCILVPSEHVGSILDAFREYGIEVKVMQLYARPFESRMPA